MIKKRRMCYRVFSEPGDATQYNYYLVKGEYGFWHAVNNEKGSIAYPAVIQPWMVDKFREFYRGEPSNREQAEFCNGFAVECKVNPFTMADVMRHIVSFEEIDGQD
jgi:hypothetical protein